MGKHHKTPPVAHAAKEGVATIAPPDRGVWWERWSDVAQWREETDPLPGDSEAPAAVVAKARAAEWPQKRKTITDENAARDGRNTTLRDDPDVAKRLKKKNASAQGPILPDPTLDDSAYNKAVRGYNVWVRGANHAIVGKKFEPLRDLDVTKSKLEQGWIDRGLPVDFWKRRIDDECAKKIGEFRKGLPQKGTELDHLYKNEPKELKELGARVSDLEKDLKARQKKADELELLLRARRANKKAKPDAVASLETQYDQAQKDLAETQKALDAAKAEEKKAQDLGLLSAFKGGTKSGISDKDIDFWCNAAKAFHLDEGVGAAFYALGACPHALEGTPPTVVTYDGTFTYGVGFNVSKGIGWKVLKQIAVQPKGYPPDEQAALAEMWTYFKKCGVHIHDTDADQTAAAFPVDVVHLEGDPVRGYVVTNDVNLTSGVHEVGAQAHQVTQGAAYECIRHTPEVLSAFIAAGISDKLPDQRNDAAASAMRTLEQVNFRVFCEHHKDTLRLPQFIKGRALRIMLIHYHHWGETFRVNKMMTWALSRQLVPCTVKLKTGATAGPLDVKGDNPKDPTDAISLGDIADVQFTPTFETDVQFARLMGPYAMRVLSAEHADRGQMAGYWTDFLGHLKKHDGQAELAAKQPQFFLQSVHELKASDATITDAVVASEYATETIQKSKYVLGKKRDIDEIAAFNSKREEPQLLALLSMLARQP